MKYKTDSTNNFFHWINNALPSGDCNHIFEISQKCDSLTRDESVRTVFAPISMSMTHSRNEAFEFSKFSNFRVCEYIENYALTNFFRNRFFAAYKNQ